MGAAKTTYSQASPVIFTRPGYGEQRGRNQASGRSLSDRDGFVALLQYPGDVRRYLAEGGWWKERLFCHGGVRAFEEVVDTREAESLSFGA